MTTPHRFQMSFDGRPYAITLDGPYVGEHVAAVELRTSTHDLPRVVLHLRPTSTWPTELDLLAQVEAGVPPEPGRPRGLQAPQELVSPGPAPGWPAAISTRASPTPSAWRSPATSTDSTGRTATSGSAPSATGEGELRQTDTQRASGDTEVRSARVTVRRPRESSHARRARGDGAVHVPSCCPWRGQSASVMQRGVDALQTLACGGIAGPLWPHSRKGRSPAGRTVRG